MAFALRYAPASAVSAIRETSVLFALAFAALMLKEKMTGSRIGAALLIVVGAVLIAMQ